MHFEECPPLTQAKELGSIGLFDEKYAEDVKVYFIGTPSADRSGRSYSAELCGGPHVNFTGEIKKFRIMAEKETD